MSASARAEVEALRRPFRIGVIAVLAFIVAIGGIVAAFGTPADRPAGIAERWLVALSDTTRDGLDDDALERMKEHQLEGGLFMGIGPLDAFAELRDDRGAVDDGEARFDTVRVGRAFDDLTGEGSVLVPVEVTPYEADDPVEGYVLLIDERMAEDGFGVRDADGWKVIAFGSPQGIEDVGAFESICTGDSCPGFPLDRPERAPIGFWLGTLALGVLIAAGCSAAVRAATPKLAAS